jgi:hypothetical protein
VSDGCRYCEGRSARYVVYVRDTERNVPSTDGVATTCIVACDCASPERRCALSSGGGGPETKGPATNARQFAQHCRDKGMAHGVQWAIDPSAKVQRLMLQAYPHPGSPLEGQRWDALAALEAMATPEQPRDRYVTVPQGAQDVVSGPTPHVEAEEPPANDSGGHSGRFDADDWATNHPEWMNHSNDDYYGG